MHRNILILKYLKTALEMDLVSIKDEGEDEGQVDERNFSGSQNLCNHSNRHKTPGFHRHLC